MSPGTPTGHDEPGHEFAHRPVMLDEVVELMRPVPPGWLVDATVGGGGHARALLEAVPQVSLLGLDRDTEAVEAARAALAGFGHRAVVAHRRYDDMAEALAQVGATGAAGVLFDLGVSSHQFDRPERGFSYRFDAPLDMRMDRSTGPTAADLLASWDEHTLAALLRRHGEERLAGRIAAAIVAARPVVTTGQLAEVVASAVPMPARRRGHPAKRVFQALRAAVNSELEVLPVALDQALRLVVPGGRVVVISYHSGEDRLVKEAFVTASTGGCTCPPTLPCVCGAVPTVRLLNRGSRQPSAAERSANPRSESARLRAVEALAPELRRPR
jgi:16S rRNA (cytosine1402-N4)-methyltransferase